MDKFENIVISGNSYGFTDVDAIHSLSGYATEQWVENYTYDKDTINEMVASGGGSSSAVTVLSGDVISLSGDVQNISGDIITLSGDVEGLEAKLDTLSGNVYTKDETSGKTELSTEFDKYYKKTETSGKTELSTAFAAKQNVLTAGENITISGNVISATGGGSLDVPISAGTGANAIIYNRPENVASNSSSNAFGHSTTASGAASVAFGGGTVAGGNYSLAGGMDSKALNIISMAYGDNATASGQMSVAVGERTVAGGDYSFVAGFNTTASGSASVAFGQYTESKNRNEVSFGIYNQSNRKTSQGAEIASGCTLMSVGTGYHSVDEDVRQNALEIRKDESIYVVKNPGDYNPREVIKLQDYLFDGNNYYNKSETSGKTEIQNALDLKLDASAFTESDYYKKSETSSKTEIDDALALKQDELIAGDYITIDSANTISTSGLVTVEDNEVSEYKNESIVYTRYMPAQGETLSFNDGAHELKVNGIYWSGIREGNIRLILINSTGGTIEGGILIDTNGPKPAEKFIPAAMAEYISVSPASINIMQEITYTVTNDDWRISYCEAYVDDDGTIRNGKIKNVYTIFGGGQSKDVIEDEIYPELAKVSLKQDKLYDGFDTYIEDNEVKINKNTVIQDKYIPFRNKDLCPTSEAVYRAISGITASGITSAECQSMINESISGKTDESDFSAHTANTTVHITAQERTDWDAKPNVWSGTEQQWAAISGGTLDNNTIYLIY